MELDISIEDEKALEEFLDVILAPNLRELRIQIVLRLLQMYDALLLDCDKLIAESTVSDFFGRPAMSETDLKQVKNLIDDLSPVEQLQLLGHLLQLRVRLNAQLNERQPDEAIDPTETIVIGEESGPTALFRWFRDSDGSVVIHMGDNEVFRGMFQPFNYVEAAIEKWQSEGRFQELKTKVRRELERKGRDEFARQNRPVDNEFAERTNSFADKWSLATIRRVTEEAAQRMNDNLGPAMGMVLRKVIEAGMFSGANQLQALFDEPSGKLTAAKIKQRVFKWDWERLKPILGISHGGAGERESLWTDSVCECISTNHERLKPIWREAKKVAKSAKASREPKRREAWAAAVLGTYPDLPPDLVDRLSAPRSEDAKPADIALLHAARQCYVSSSTKTLRKQIRLWKARRNIKSDS
jgi:hypothetical protein